MLETVFVILLLAALVILGVFVFKALLKIIITIVIIVLLIMAGNKLFGNDWLFKKGKNQETSSNITNFI